MWDEEKEQEEQEKEIQELVNAFSSKKKMKEWKEKQKVSAEHIEEPEKEKVIEKQLKRKERIIITDGEVVEPKEKKKRPTKTSSQKKRKPVKSKNTSSKKSSTAKKNASSNRAKLYKGFPGYIYAGFWIRLCAYVVDLLCIWGITSVVLDKFIVSLTNMQIDSAKTSIYGIIGTVIYLSYFILLTKITNGQTLGKMIFGLQVICFKEEKLSWSTVLIREGACRFILKTIKVFYLPTAFTKKKQHVGDVFTDTSVVTLNTIRAYQESKA